jgi:hypothetical protein
MDEQDRRNDDSSGIDSEDFRQWLRSVDDDETDIQELHKEYLEEKRRNLKNHE